ncbi:MAG: T9SS type A sorting domain-containing protein [Ignavibacteriae bacterium]|nr:T9SS type A sorting domain-containing protein [Ignavibacteriota bacterium]
MKKLFVVLVMLAAMNAYSQMYPPPNGSVCPGSILFNWDDVPLAVSYRIQVITGATTIIDADGLLQSQYLVLAGILQSNTQYYWRIKANLQGGGGNWSVQWLFNTLSLPNSPSLLLPPNNATNVPINTTFDWSDVSGATYYIFQLSKYPLFDSLVVNDTTPLPFITLQYNTQYYWRIKSGNSCGTGNWSSVWTFQTSIIGPPAPPLLICDTANVPLTPILDWNSLPSVMSYRVQVSTSPTFASTIINTVVNVSQYTVPSGILNYNSHYYWRVNATNVAGTGPWSTLCSFNTIAQSGIINISSEVPTENKLYSNYPNPFNPTTKIKFAMPKAGDAKVIVYDLMGREIQTLVNERLQAGTYETTFDGSTLNSGVYFYKLATDGFTETKKMLMLK